MKKLLLALCVLSISSIVSAASIEELEGKYEGNYGSWLFGNICTVEIIVEGDDGVVDLIVNGNEKIEMNAMDLELVNSRLDRNETLFRGAMGSNYQLEADLTVNHNKLTAVIARSYSTGFFGRVLEDTVKCKNLLKI